MEKKDLVKLLDDIFKPLGYTRKGNNWVINSEELVRVVNLQRSNFGQFFYLNYGFIVRKLPLTTKTHVEHRLASADKEEQQKIRDLFDLETKIPSDLRLNELRSLIISKVVERLQSISTEDDLYSDLKKGHIYMTFP